MVSKYFYVKFTKIILKFYIILDFSPENAKDFNQETIFGQHFLVCALQEIGCLLLNMGTMANNLISDNTCSKFKMILLFIYLLKVKLVVIQLQPQEFD